MMKQEKAILLLSGGLDSGSLLFWMLKNRKEVFPLFVNYGQMTFPGEVRSVKFLLRTTGLSTIRPLNIRNISKFGSGSLVGINQSDLLSLDQYFPSRNLLLITIAAMYAYQKKADSIYIGLVADSAGSLPDCSTHFLDAVQKVIQVEYPNLVLEAPFISRTKLEVVSEAINLGLIPEITFCCNSVPDHHCWNCSSCKDRLSTLKSLGRI